MARPRARCFGPHFDGCILIGRIKGCAMGQVLHGSATTTEAIRRAIQHSKESLRALLRHQSKDGAQVEGAQLGRGPTDGTKGTAIDGAVDRGRGGHRWLPPAYASAS